MDVIEFQLTRKEVFDAHVGHTWRHGKGAIFVLFLPVALMSPIFLFLGGYWHAGWVVLISLLSLPGSYLMRFYLDAAEPKFIARTKMVFSETGVIFITDSARSEMGWELFYTWCQSKNHFFLHVDTRGQSIAIPKRAFTNEQKNKFLKLVKKIKLYGYQPNRAAGRGKNILDLKHELPDKVFLSYAREDFDTALRLYNDLLKSGVEIWFDRKSLIGGQNWKVAIRQAIRESRFFLALLSNNSVSKKGYVQKELKHAFEILGEYPESAIFIIPVRLDNCNPTEETLQELHWINLFEDWDDGQERILNTIRSQSLIK